MEKVQQDVFKRYSSRGTHLITRTWALETTVKAAVATRVINFIVA